MNHLGCNGPLTGMNAKSQARPGGDDVRERQLMALVADGDAAAFERLFETYQPRLFRFVYRLTGSYRTSEEVVSDILLVVWNKAQTFRGDSRVSTWIYGIAYRKSLDRMRKRRPRWLPLSAASLEANDVPNLERENWVQHGIGKLSPSHQLTVMLVFYAGLTYEETAKATDTPLNTVKTRMFHARRALKEYLGNDDE